MQENRLLTGRISSELMRFALPFMFTNLLQSVYGAVDLFVVGQYATSADVSAVSIGSQLMMIATCLVYGIALGGTVLVGHKIGEKDMRGAAKAVGNLSVLFVAMALILTPVMLLCVNPLISLMNTPSEAVPYTRQYLTICSAGLPFIVGYNAVSAIYRGVGDSRTPVYFIVIACIVNVVLDFVLTGALGLGTRGAAYATIFAQGVAFIAALFYMKRKGLGFEVSKTSFVPAKYEITSILKYGAPIALQDVLVHFSFLVNTAIINGLGLTASAAVGVTEKIMGFAFIPPSAFSSGVATMVAQNMGAGQGKRAVSSVKWGVAYSLIFGVLVVLLSNTIPEILTGFFTEDSAVAVASAQYMRTYSLDCMLVSFIFSVNAYLTGTGKSLICFIHSIAATFLVRIPVTYFISKTVTDSLLPMGWAAPCASLFSIIFCCAYFIIRQRRR